MHALALVVIPAEGDPTEHVERLMAPHLEDWDEDSDVLSGWWDWYQIGGRFTGSFTDYTPSADLANVEPCTLCGGTGKRADMVVANGCNGCRGNGVRVKWPTPWRDHAGDVQPVSILALGDPAESYVVLTETGCVRRDGTDEGGRWCERDRETYAAEVRALLIDVDPTARVVLVDFHS